MPIHSAGNQTLYIWVFLLQAAWTIALCHSEQICDELTDNNAEKYLVKCMPATYSYLLQNHGFKVWCWYAVRHTWIQTVRPHTRRLAISISSHSNILNEADTGLSNWTDFLLDLFLLWYRNWDFTDLLLASSNLYWSALWCSGLGARLNWCPITLYCVQEEVFGFRHFSVDCDEAQWAWIWHYIWSTGEDASTHTGWEVMAVVWEVMALVWWCVSVGGGSWYWKSGVWVMGRIGEVWWGEGFGWVVCGWCAWEGCGEVKGYGGGWVMGRVGGMW